MVLYFIGVYIINRTLHGHLEIKNFSTWREIFYLCAAMQGLFISSYMWDFLCLTSKPVGEDREKGVPRQ